MENGLLNWQCYNNLEVKAIKVQNKRNALYWKYNLLAFIWVTFKSVIPLYNMSLKIWI